MNSLLGMPRRRTIGCGGFVFHVMNRSAKQLTLFDTPSDYELFLEVLDQAERKCPIRLLEYCVMPNHCHLLVWPEHDVQLSEYMRWVTGTHGQRWRRATCSVGKGAVYQGRFRWVAVQDGRHYEIARQYIRQNPVRAHLVERAVDWPWSSASHRPAACRPYLSAGPIANGESTMQSDESRLDFQTESQMRESLHSNRPFGDRNWSRSLEVRQWLTAVLAAHSDALMAGRSKNPRKDDDLSR